MRKNAAAVKASRCLFWNTSPQLLGHVVPPSQWISALWWRSMWGYDVASLQPQFFSSTHSLHVCFFVALYYFTTGVDFSMALTRPQRAKHKRAEFLSSTSLILRLQVVVCIFRIVSHEAEQSITTGIFVSSSTRSCQTSSRATSASFHLH